MGYEQTRLTDELSRSVQRAVGVPPRQHETLGELVKGIAAEHWVQRPENLISEKPTQHEVRVDGRTLHTFCFVDALMLPFVLREGAIEVRSDGPTGGEVSAFVTEGGVEGSPPGVVVSFGAARAGRDGLRDAMPLPERIPFAGRLRALGRADAAGRHRRPPAGRSVRFSP